MRRSSMRTVPCVASSNRGIISTSVVLPDPVRPTTASVEPGGHMERHVPQHPGPLFSVAKRDIVEPDRTTNLPDRRDHFFRVGDVGRTARHCYGCTAGAGSSCGGQMM